LTCRSDEELDPNRGPGFGCFVTQAVFFAVILLLIPIGLFTLRWPLWVLITLLLIAMVLLFFVSMTSVFLLRVFFAGRRRGRATRGSQPQGPSRVVSTKPAEGDGDEPEGRGA
jgi:hypothetical protein